MKSISAHCNHSRWHLANSIFLGDYLTSEGQPGQDDRAMIADAGFVIEGTDEPTLPSQRHDLVITRHHGAGYHRDGEHLSHRRAVQHLIAGG